MNLKTTRLIKMAVLAYAIWAEDDTDGVETSTAIGQLCMLEHIAADIVAEADPDVDYSKWNDLITNCHALRKLLRDFTIDLSGEQTQRVVECASILGLTGVE